MEQMPYRAEFDTLTTPRVETPIVSSDWQSGLPVLCGTRVVLRELRVSDAASLFAMLTTEEVTRFISPPPSTVEGFERFIQWTLRQRAAGRDSASARNRRARTAFRECRPPGACEGSRLLPGGYENSAGRAS